MRKLPLSIQKAVILSAVFLPTLSWAKEDATIKVNDVTLEDNTQVTIKKEKASEHDDTNEFVFLSEKGEILGDPEPGLKESYANWKKACEDWKIEVKELNKNNEVLSLNCNAPFSTRLSNGTQVYKSIGTYTVKTKRKPENSKNTHP